MSTVYKALADPTRRKILQTLREREMTAGDIADMFDFAKPTISRHLNVLKSAELIHGSKQGTTIIYRLNLSVLEEALMSMMDTFKLTPGGRNNEEAIQFSSGNDL